MQRREFIKAGAAAVVMPAIISNRPRQRQRRKPLTRSVGYDFFLLNPRAVFTQATSSHAEARLPRFVRGLAAGFAALRAFPSKAALSSAHFRPAPIGLVSLHFDFPFVRGDKSNRSHLCRMFGKYAIPDT